VLSKDRANLVHFLQGNKVDAQIHYTDNFNMTLGDKTDMPMTDRLCKQVISLPNHQWLTDGEVETVANTVRNFFE
jgi:dTDP-4-amino-4,6-dideoxygalactose transaminase